MMYYLHVEAAHFDATVYDTQDLSAIRGSSAALLWAPGEVEGWLAEQPKVDTAETVFTGASEGLFKVEAGIAAEDLVTELQDWLRGHALYRHFAFVIATEPFNNDFPACRERIDARRRFAGMQDLTLVVPDDSSDKQIGYCAADRTRPALMEMLPKHRNETHRKPPWVSLSVLHRHQAGRERRQDYYRKIVADGGSKEDQAAVSDLLKDRGFSDEFAEIVGDSPKQLLPTLERKLAVIHMDGNSFGKIREMMSDRMASTMDGLALYSIEIKEKRAGLVRRLIEWASRSAETDDWPRPEGYMSLRNDTKQTVEQLRFETLLWGGDEMFWVLPAWAAFDFMGQVQAEVGAWSIDANLPLTHSAGMVLCNYKTPIRQAKNLAEELANGANAGNDDKELTGKRHGVQIQVLESVDIPDGYLRHYRSTLFGIDGSDPFRQRPFTLPGGMGWEGVVAKLATLTGTLPRSPIYKLLRRAKDEGALTDQATDLAEGIKRDVVALLERSGLGEGELFSPNLGYNPIDSYGEAHAHQLMPLVHLVTLWDYVDPFGRFVVAEATGDV